MKLGEYFPEAEFIRSETAQRHNIDNRFETEEHRQNAIKLCKKLDELRELFGRLRITSGYRSKRLNKLVGGVGDSKHTTGEAADIFPLDVPILKVWDYVQKNWNGGYALNASKGFIHLDSGAKRTWNY